MNAYFTNILDRHSKAGNLVKPRLRSRFESESVGSAETMPIQQPDMVETKEIYQAGKLRFPENHPAALAADLFESQRIDAGTRLPAAPSEPVSFRDDHVQRRDGGIQSTTDDSIPVGEGITYVESRNDTLALQQQNRKPLLVESNRQTRPKVKRPVGHFKPVNVRGSHWEPQDELTRPTKNNSVLMDARPAEMEPHYDNPVLQQQKREPVAAQPVEQTRSLENDTLSPVIHRYPTLEPEKEPARTADLPESVSSANLAEKTLSRPIETGLSFDHGLYNRINIMLARLQDNQKIHSTEPAETNVSERLMDTKPDHAAETEKERASSPLLAAYSIDVFNKESLPEANQEQQIAGAPDNRDRTSNGLLWPPAWLSDVQTDINRRWNEKNWKREPEPVINVTIGRVEVWAVRTDPPQRELRKKKPSGVMSLDEYFKQRERRG